MRLDIALTKDMTQDGVIKALLPMVKRTVARMSRGPNARVRDDDLLSAGMMGLYEATKQFDPSRVQSFVAYAAMRVRGAMLDELRRNDTHTQDQRQRSKELEAKVRTLRDKLSRAPAEEEIAQAMNLSLDDYRSMLEALTRVKAVTIDPDSHTVQTQMADTPDPEAASRRAELKRQLADAISLLPEKEQQVMGLHYDHDLSFREVGEVMSLTAARVCQLHAQAVHRLRAQLGGEESNDE
jgi:RNA polymerase sigma factor FliA